MNFKFSIIIQRMIPVKEISHKLDEWNFDFGESGLSSTTEIDKISENCKLFRSPSIIFGKNYCKIEMKHKQFSLLFNAEEALKYINYEHREKNFYKKNQEPKINGITFIPNRLQIKHAEQWKNLEKPKDIQITEIKESSDSFYVSPFKGFISGNAEIERMQEMVIPLHKLGPQNQIKFYQQGSLYEDELDDNGLIQYEYKLRCMQQNWFGLIRCYARVDDVAISILDTRIYWQKGWNKIARQFNVKQARWQDIKNKGFEFMGGWSTNPNQSHMVYEHLDEVFAENQFIHLK